MPDPVVTRQFAMHGARAAIEGGLSHIEDQVTSIEQAVVENPGLAFDLAKTVVESACKTILNERNVSFEPDDGLPRLFRAVTMNLSLLPVSLSRDAEARKSLAQTLSGLHTSLVGVCELRNAFGFASHGSGEPRPAMESVQALLAAQAADAIVGFLYRIHRQERAPVQASQLVFDDNEAFNGYVDEANAVVRIFELEYRPSEVLFNCDQQAYRDLLSGFEPEASQAGPEAV
ncbi:MAG TPA: abortive infection family protein [Thermoanaerobaculia bacterium]|nr:abortive infection family protein [Thermoanaerobaculia bacterium]